MILIEFGKDTAWETRNTPTSDEKEIRIGNQVDGEFVESCKITVPQWMIVSDEIKIVQDL